MTLTKEDKKKLKSLHTVKGRKASNCFMAEGIRLLEESIRHDWHAEMVGYCPAIVSPRGRKLVDHFRSRKTVIEEISARNLDMVSDSVNSQGMIGVFRIPDRRPDDFPGLERGRFLLLENIADPGNTGTLIRSAAAFGFDFVWQAGEGADPYNSKVVRATAGAIFAIPVVSIAIADLTYYKRSLGARLIAADLTGTDIGTGLEYDREPVILALGAEAAGLSREIRQLADLTLHIQHEEKVESLNVAVAGSIIMKALYDIRGGK